ncbi:MAG: metal-dependent transcriptional regulator [Armatimonadota bacterium]|nr:metal-dependent transcriptional regulator [Armatimonadota bacterium]
MSVHDIAKTERTEMYLKAVYTVAQSMPPVTISKVAEYMGVSAPSSYEMLKRLESHGLLQSGGGEGYRLTRRGMETATRVVRRLRLAERLLTDVLRLPLARVYAEACKLEHVISPDVEARLDEVLGHPATCPHGLPIPGDRPLPTESLPTLDDLSVWNRATVVSIPEEDEVLVAHLAEVGVTPGAVVLVREVGPVNGPITVQIAEQIRAISRDAARRVRVRPLPQAP